MGTLQPNYGSVILKVVYLFFLPEPPYPMSIAVSGDDYVRVAPFCLHQKGWGDVGLNLILNIDENVNVYINAVMIM